MNKRKRDEQFRVKGQLAVASQRQYVETLTLPHQDAQHYSSLKKEMVSDEFWSNLKSQLTEKRFIMNSCMASIDPGYVAEEIWEKTTTVHVLYRLKLNQSGQQLQQVIDLELNSRNVCGFALSSVVDVKMSENESKQRALYLQLICSSQRRGKDMMANIEEYAKKQGLKGIILYAAHSYASFDEVARFENSNKLVKRYQQYGFKRSTYLCAQSSNNILQDNLHQNWTEGYIMTKCL